MKMTTNIQIDGTSYLTILDAAKKYGYHPESIRRLYRQGEIEGVIIGKRQLLVSQVSMHGHTIRTGRTWKRGQNKSNGETND